MNMREYEIWVLCAVISGARLVVMTFTNASAVFTATLGFLTEAFVFGV